MLTRSLKHLLTPSLTNTHRRFIGHIKNMDEENARVEVEQLQRRSGLIKNDRVYKPSYTIEFNREG